jgi:uncharacterized protein YabE (DUF348 family)/3D (Asp-Asp-Asp) domain-containing protein
MYQKLKNELKSFFTISTKTTFLAGLIAMACIASFYSLQKSIVISIDGKEKTIKTYKSDIKSTLKKQNIVLGPKDRIAPNVESILKDGDMISIKKSIPVYLLVDGKEIEVHTSEETIKDILRTEGISYTSLDRIEPLLDESPKEGMKVSITRVESRLVQEYESIDFSTVIKNDNTLPNTVKKVAQEGNPGEKKITFRVVFENGIEVSRKVIQELVTRDPSERVLIHGTINIQNLSRGGIPRSKETFSKVTPTDLPYNAVISCMATAYSSQERGIGTITASGKPVKRNSNGYSTIAVDPRIIPMGTKVYVEGYGYAVAEDTGSAIKGNKIDVYLDTIEDCINWGRRTANVYILN